MLVGKGGGGGWGGEGEQLWLSEDWHPPNESVKERGMDCLSGEGIPVLHVLWSVGPVVSSSPSGGLV